MLTQPSSRGSMGSVFSHQHPAPPVPLPLPPRARPYALAEAPLLAPALLPTSPRLAAWEPARCAPSPLPAPLSLASSSACVSSSTPPSPTSSWHSRLLARGLSRGRASGGPPSPDAAASAGWLSLSRAQSAGRHGRRGGRVVPVPATAAAAAPAPAGPGPAAGGGAEAPGGEPSGCGGVAEAEGELCVPFTSAAGTAVTLRRVRTLEEVRQVAMLRAEAYYVDNHSRFVGSLKKKFAEQEVESLQQRTSILSRQGQPYSECLVAVDTSGGGVLACIDARLPAALNGTHPHGVPQDDPHGAYLLNVVVREEARGQGLGRRLLLAAMHRCARRWGAARLYTHVDAGNEVAFRLYRSCGFAPHSADSRYEAASTLGQTLLLLADGEDVPSAA